MKYYPVQLTGKRSFKCFGIFPYPVDTDIDISNKLFSNWRKLESDDVCQGVVIKIILVERKEVVVRTEDIINCIYPLAFFLKKPLQEGFQNIPVGEEERCNKVMELNSGWMIHFSKIVNRKQCQYFSFE